VPSRRLHEAGAVAGDGGALVRSGRWSIAAGIVIFAGGLALEAGTRAIGNADFAQQVVDFDFSTFDPKVPNSLASAATPRPQTLLSPDLLVASLESAVPAGLSVDPQDWRSDRPTNTGDSFNERFVFGPGGALFNERFPRLAASGDQASGDTRETGRRADGARRPAAGTYKVASLAVGDSVPKPAPTSAAPAASPTDSHSLPDTDNRTAIYDISARTVYLPNGKKLEAHSGLGSSMDDPRHVHVRMTGPTPPNVYDLTMREQLFHGVRAIRLNPVGRGKMFGRAGILAHSYMLGPNGQSNGCVSISDYPAFLDAFLKGEVTRLVVVEHLDTVPSPKTASGWIPERIKDLFWRS
jgi:hypothetical protein